MQIVFDVRSMGARRRVAESLRARVLSTSVLRFSPENQAEAQSRKAGLRGETVSAATSTTAQWAAPSISHRANFMAGSFWHFLDARCSARIGFVIYFAALAFAAAMYSS